jgi:hypothetical protein
MPKSRRVGKKSSKKFNMKNLFIVCVWILSVLQIQITFAQSVAFRTKTTHPTLSPINHESTDGKPDAIVLITQQFDTEGPNCGYEVGVEYKNNQWNLVPLLGSAPIPDKTNFNVMVFPKSSACAFKLTAYRKDLLLKIKNPAINRNPNAKLIVTNEVKGGIRNPANIGVRYKDHTWFIYNENGTEIPQNAVFNVFIAETGFLHAVTTANIHPDWPSTSIITNPGTDSKKDLLLFATHKYRSKGIDSPLSVWWDKANNKWTVFSTTTPPLRDCLGEDVNIYVHSPADVCCLPLSNQIRFRTTTGGDDLRSYNKAYFTINFTDGTSSSEMLMYQGQKNNQISAPIFDLPSAIQLCKIKSVTIRHDGLPNFPDIYDNWNLEYLEIALVSSDRTEHLIYKGGGSPLIRFTGDTRTFIAPGRP